jgi:hypothetical protein
MVAGLQTSIWEGIMAYVTITTWKMADGTDREATLERARSTHLPAIKAMGATRQTMVELSETESVLVSEWPDQATREAAMQKIAEIRSKVAETGEMKMTSEQKGAVLLRV